MEARSPAAGPQGIPRVREVADRARRASACDSKDRTDTVASDCTPRDGRLKITRWAASLGSAPVGTSRHHRPVIGCPNAPGEDSISLSMRKPTLRIIRNTRRSDPDASSGAG
jgi:hypothetical protein